MKTARITNRIKNLLDFVGENFFVTFFLIWLAYGATVLVALALGY